jgi:hypothetical protein
MEDEGLEKFKAINGEILKEIKMAEFQQEFIIHFGAEFKRINAYTLASTLVSFSDAAKIANNQINPGYEIEIFVEALGGGSFKTKIKAIYNKAASNLFNVQDLKSIVLALIASFIYEHAIQQNPNIQVTVLTDEVVITSQKEKIIIPREVHDKVKELEKSILFKDKMGKVFQTIENDKAISSFGISRTMEQIEPDILIPREQFALISSESVIEENSREIIENTSVEIVRAILEKNKRRWEFVWQGFKIAAPVSCDRFFNDFFAHKITIAPGDILNVKLKILQTKDKDTGIYTNSSYEIVEVLSHEPRVSQTQIDIH